MLNGIEEKGLNKDVKFNIKVRKYPGASSIDILDHLKPTLRKEPDEIIIYAGTNDLTNGSNYLHNVKKIIILPKEISKNTKHCFSSIICRSDKIDMDEKI